MKCNLNIWNAPTTVAVYQAQHLLCNSKHSWCSNQRVNSIPGPTSNITFHQWSSVVVKVFAKCCCWRCYSKIYSQYECSFAAAANELTTLSTSLRGITNWSFISSLNPWKRSKDKFHLKKKKQRRYITKKIIEHKTANMWQRLKLYYINKIKISNKQN